MNRTGLYSPMLRLQLVLLADLDIYDITKHSETGK